MIIRGTVIVLILMSLLGCASYQTFHHLARSNDTVILVAGWKKSFTRDSIRVTFTDFNDVVTVYDPGDPGIRAVINMYPDPLSNMVVSKETGLEISPGALDFSRYINENITDNDNDWWQTIVILNLPDLMALGQADITIEVIDPLTSSVIESTYSTVEIVDGVGEPNPFSAQYPWGGSFDLTDDLVRNLERAGHYQVNITGGTGIPAAVTVEMTHSPDIDNGGVGRVSIVNPTGDIKNIHWSKNGTGVKVILLPTASGAISNMVDYKFYVSGGIENLSVSSVTAYDQFGVEMPAIVATIIER